MIVIVVGVLLLFFRTVVAVRPRYLLRIVKSPATKGQRRQRFAGRERPKLPSADHFPAGDEMDENAARRRGGNLLPGGKVGCRISEESPPLPSTTLNAWYGGFQDEWFMRGQDIGRISARPSVRHPEKHGRRTGYR